MYFVPFDHLIIGWRGKVLKNRLRRGAAGEGNKKCVVVFDHLLGKIDEVLDAVDQSQRIIAGNDNVPSFVPGARL